MKNALLLFLSASHLHAELMTAGKIVAQLEFDDSPGGQHDFTEFVKDIRHPTYLLVDLIEEDFRQEIIPHLIGRSRSALLQRKFVQFYRGTPFRQATLLQRQKTGRRDDDMLFSALTNPELVTRWLNILLAHQVPLAGIYSVPQISEPLVKNHPAEYLLLISWERTAGLRQTYFSGHRLQMSRLTPVTDTMTFQEVVVEELARTYQYLKGLSLLPSEQTLDVRLLASSQDLLEMQLSLPQSSDMRYDFVDLAKLADSLGIKRNFADSDATQIFLHQLTAHSPRTHYASAQHVHYYTLWRLRRALNWASAALLLGSLAWGTADIWQSGWNADEANSMKAEARRLQDEARQITATFPNTIAPASDMKTTVSIMRELERQALPPGAIMGSVSKALDRHPQIELEELTWGMDAAEPMAEGLPARLVTLKGRLLGFENNYRAALDYLGRFERDLEKLGYQIAVLNRPIDLSPSGSISDSREAQQEALTFSLKLLQRPTP